MIDAQDRVPNAGQDVDDATEPDPEYDQLGSDGNPFEPKGSAKEPIPEDTDDDAVPADSDDDAVPADSDAGFGMGIPAANDPQRLPDGPGPT
jgi:hypothetical protein